MINLDDYSAIFIANWKLNGNFSFLKEYYDKLKVSSNNCTVICPPSIYLNSIKADKENLHTGAQDVSFYNEGAYTGELSASMLKENAIDFCLVGHSERRQYFHETNESIKIKCENLLRESIIPVVCIGETLEQKENKLTEEILFTQIKKGIPNIANNKNSIIAYEPVWAIGTGLTPTLDEINSVHELIKNFNSKFKNFKVLYGGSVKSTNSKDINSLKQVDGCLIGGASLKVDEFNTIIS